jgi:predicted transcriptional regulator
MKKQMSTLAGKLVNDLDLLQRHIVMLQLVTENEPIGIIKLAEMLKLPQHKVRYSLRLLESDGLIEATTAGARVTKKVKPFLNELKDQLGSMNVSIKNIQKSLEDFEK